MDEIKSQQPSLDIGVHVPPELRGGNYANTVQVRVSQTEAVMDFIMVHPSDNPKGTLVSRAILPLEFALQLALNLRQAIEIDKENRSQ